VERRRERSGLSRLAPSVNLGSKTSPIWFDCLGYSTDPKIWLHVRVRGKHFPH
jgi:hypothetical protein